MPSIGGMANLSAQLWPTPAGALGFWPVESVPFSQDGA
jgi:hypothetical protein